MNKKGLILPGILVVIFIFAFAQCNRTGDLTTGKEIYRVYCVNCHGIDGSLSTSGALDLSRSRLPLEGRIEIIRHGRVTMMGFEGVLTEEQIDSVARYTQELLK